MPRYKLVSERPRSAKFRRRPSFAVDVAAKTNSSNRSEIEQPEKCWSKTPKTNNGPELLENANSGDIKNKLDLKQTDNPSVGNSSLLFKANTANYGNFYQRVGEPTKCLRVLPKLQTDGADGEISATKAHDLSLFLDNKRKDGESFQLGKKYSVLPNINT